MLKNLKYILNKKKLDFQYFILFFFIYILHSMIPQLVAYTSFISKVPPVLIPSLKFLHAKINDLLAALPAGIFFYIFVDAERERGQIKNELKYIINQYLEMKKEILIQLLRSESKGLKLITDDHIQTMHQNPQEAQQYFTHERFFEIYMLLDQKTLNRITQSIHSFLEEFSYTKHQFVQDGDNQLAQVYNILKWYLHRIEESAESEERMLDWVEEANPKSCNPIYCIICQDLDGKDPILAILDSALKKYN